MKDVNISINGFAFSLEKIFVPYLVKPLFLIFIYYGMYSRTSGLFGLSGGKIAVLISAGLFSLACIHMFFLANRTRISALAFLMVLFFMIAAFTPFLSAFIYNERYMHVFRFVVELGICFGMFFSVYYFIREKLISPKFVIYSFVFMGGVVALQILSTIIGLSGYMRLGREIGGLNYLGNTLAVSAISYIILLNGKDYSRPKRLFVVFFFFVVFLALVMTGTRAGLIAFVAGLFLYQVFGIKSRRLTKYVIMFCLFIVVVISIIWINVDLTFLFTRYTFESLYRMALIRFNLYYSAVADLTFVEFVFGRADLSALDSSTLDDLARFVNPHNAFLSIIRFNGLIPFILFFTLFVTLYVNYFKVYLYHLKNRRFRTMETTIVIFLTLSFINVMLSGGTYTRNFFMYFAIGYAIGYIDLLRTVKSDEEYSKLVF